MKYAFRAALPLLIALAVTSVAGTPGARWRATTQSDRMKVILDTDIGSDIDDAWALAFVIRHERFEPLGITITDGNTPARAKVACKLLHRMGRGDLPVAIGRRTPDPASIDYQFAWAEDFEEKKPSAQPAADFIIETVKRHPGEVTLIAVGPLQNVADALRKEPNLGKYLKRIVLMSGCVYGQADRPATPVAEYNVEMAIADAQMVYGAGLPLTIVPLDATTHVVLKDAEREQVRKHQTPLTISLEALYRLYLQSPQSRMVLHDQLAVAEAASPDTFFRKKEILPLIVDGKGFTRIDRRNGKPVVVCFQPKRDQFVQFYLSHLVDERPGIQSRPQAQSASDARADYESWPVYGGGPEQIRYSTLEQINRSNVRRLEVAWTYDPEESGGLQTNPIIVDGVLYTTTPKHKVIALDAATGKLRWKFDSKIEGSGPNRGVTFWADGDDRRIFTGQGQYVYALDARTGEAIDAFGDAGRIDLRESLSRPPGGQSVRLTTPGVVYEDLLIVGGRVSEGLPASPGHIRAYDVRSGKLRWTFHTIPHPGEFGYDTWPKDAWTYIGGANNWTGMAVDHRRGIVYAPTGSAAADFYGANRHGDNLFANSLIALEAETGKRVWHFQAVRHDMWDRDFPSPPSLVTVTREGRRIDAVAQTTKQGYVFVFDRADGRPLFSIEYRKYPPSTVDGELAADTQPLPTRPAPFSRQRLTEDLLTRRTPAARKEALAAFRTFTSNGQFVPFAVGKETVIFPGYDGGAEWGGSAFDPETGILYVNANEMAWTGMLAPTPPGTTARRVYLRHCAACHRDNLQGEPPQMPSLEGIGSRRDEDDLTRIIRQGAGRMPGFPSLTGDEVSGLVDYLRTGEDERVENISSSPIDLKYRFTGYKKFLDADNYPAIAPPWGTLNAINLNTGEYAWKIPLGEYPELVEKGMKNTGSENYGGPIVTAGGLVFIGATNFDKKFRAFDKATGKLLWEARLPFSGNGTPATYQVDGRQFVVVPAGGGKPQGQLGPAADSGGFYVAFALPKGSARE